MEREDLRNDVAIDPSELDVETLRHADLVWKWGERLADARKRVSDMKLAKEALEAKTSLNIRACPADYSLEGIKITEDTILAALNSDTNVLKMKQALLDADGEARLLEVAYESITTRGRSLHELTELYKGQYFAGPSVPHDLPALMARKARSDGRGTVAANAKQTQTARRREK